MSPPGRGGPGRVILLAVAAAGVGGYCWVTAGTTPFTWPADLLTALALAGLVAVVALQASHRDATVPHLCDRVAVSEPPPFATLVPWLVVVGALVAFELWNFVAGPRSTHLTVSSIYDDLARSQGTRALCVLAWLVLGWHLVRR
ncbi:MAG TPA: hypothetical protein VK277_02845 [Acidimicrobiales bacterium]|nr:hypothetical protein [Acidimicrobiales bacterium]